MKRIHEGNPDNLRELTKQESIILNIQRACEASIDLAMHIVSEQKLGIPKARHVSFKLLQKAGIINANLTNTLMNISTILKILRRSCYSLKHNYFRLNENDILSIVKDYLLAQLDIEQSQGKLEIIQTENEGI